MLYIFSISFHCIKDHAPSLLSLSSLTHSHSHSLFLILRFTLANMLKQTPSSPLCRVELIFLNMAPIVRIGCDTQRPTKVQQSDNDRLETQPTNFSWPLPNDTKKSCFASFSCHHKTSLVFLMLTHVDRSNNETNYDDFFPPKLLRIHS